VGAAIREERKKESGLLISRKENGGCGEKKQLFRKRGLSEAKSGKKGEMNKRQAQTRKRNLLLFERGKGLQCRKRGKKKGEKFLYPKKNF